MTGCSGLLHQLVGEPPRLGKNREKEGFSESFTQMPLLDDVRVALKGIQVNLLTRFLESRYFKALILPDDISNDFYFREAPVKDEINDF